MDEESVQGGFEAQASLRMGSERLGVFFTQSRLIMAHLIKIGKANALLSSLLGGLSAGLSRGGSGKNALQKLAGLGPDEILSQDPDNFAIKYDSIVGLAVDPLEWNTVRLTLVTADRKIELKASRVAVEGLRETIGSLLKEKVDFRLRTGSPVKPSVG